jgi:hypothetical protein
MDHIDELMTTQSLDSARFSSAIRASLSLGKKTLNRYYEKTDFSDAYRIAMGMYTSTFPSAFKLTSHLTFQYSTLGTS